MTDQEIRIAVAEACGWKYRPDRSPVYCWWHALAKHNGLEFPPDYPNDLNAMHEAEKVLTGAGEQEYDYSKELKRVCGHNWTWKATARQRAEAFLRTLGKWKESA